MNHKVRLLAMTFIVTVELVFGMQSVFAQGEHTRRAATEIRVLIGDLRRLQAADTLPIHKLGLNHRIQGGLAALDILLRLADQEIGNPIAQYRNKISEIAKLIENNEYSEARSVLEQWAESYPLSLFETSTSGEPNHEQAYELHQELCAACHDNPAIDIERPAYNLFDEARELEYSEFLARLLVGVRGDRVTGIDNPLSDYEIAALVKFYSNFYSKKER